LPFALKTDTQSLLLPWAVVSNTFYVLSVVTRERKLRVSQPPDPGLMARYPVGRW